MVKLSNKFLVAIGLLIIASLLVVQYSSLFTFFSIENLKTHREFLQYFVKTHYLLSVFIYLIITTIIVATALPLSAFMMIVAGFLFGIKWGLLYSNIGATLGATFSYGWLHYFFGRTMPDSIKSKLEIFSKKITKYGAFYFLILHLMSLLPFFLINALAVLADIDLFTFIWTTSLGIIPISVLYNYMGYRLGEINTIGEILTTPVILTFLGLALLAVLPIVISKMRKSKRD